jgi:integrase
MYKRNNRWYSDFWYDGERYIKSYGPVSKSVAKEKDRALRADVAAGRYKKKASNPPFTKAVEEHLKKSAVENERSSYRRNVLSAGHLKTHFGTRRIRDIENNEVLIRQYIKKRKGEIKEKQRKQGRAEEEVTYTSINRELAFLRAMFNALIKAGKATKNPATLVTFFEEPQKERILTLEEEKRIIETIEESDRRYAHLKDMITIALNTAMRQGEILAMKKDWINLREGLIIVPRHSQKRKKKDKRVPINSAVRPIVKRLLRKNPDSDYLFVNPESGTRYTAIQNSWNGILKKAGLKGKPGVDKLRFHDLRHTAATKLARGGRDMKFIAQYLGHSDVRTSARYIHYSDEDLKDGAELLASPVNFHNINKETLANPRRP